jgi:hypothetical protein
MIDRAFAHPVTRLLLLAGTVVSTVATSQAPPDWTIESGVQPEKITIAPKESVERRYVVDAQPEGASVQLRLDDLPATGILVTATRKNDEGEQVSTWRGTNGQWTADQNAYYFGTYAWIGLRAYMTGAGRETFVARFRNEGTEPVTFTLNGKAETSGYDDDRDDAYVTFEHAP